MLVLTCRPGHGVAILPSEKLDPATPVGELFLDGAIEVMVTRIEEGQVEIAIRAPHPLLVMQPQPPGP